MTLAALRETNALLSALSAAFIAAGWFLIRRECKTEHVICMALAALASAALLAGEAVFLFRFGSVSVSDRSAAASVCRALLAIHLLLTIAAMLSVITTTIPAIQARWELHRRVARWATPLWLGASAAGALIYLNIDGWFLSGKIRFK